MKTSLLISSIAGVLLAIFLLAQRTRPDDTAIASVQSTESELRSVSTPEEENVARHAGTETAAPKQSDADEFAAARSSAVRDVSDRTQREFLAASDQAESIVQNLIASDRDVRRHRVVELDQGALWSLIAIARGELPQLPIRYLDLSVFPDAPCTLNASAPRKVDEVLPGNWVVRTGCLESGGLYGVEAIYNSAPPKVTFTQSLLDGSSLHLVPLQGTYALAYETAPMPRLRDAVNVN